MSFKLRRGLDADRQNIVFDEGELVYATDTKKVFVGDGSTPGGTDIMASGHNHNDTYYTKGEVDQLIQNSGDSQQQALDDHINNASVHRTINDTATGVTNLWSAHKINQELGTKSDNNHNHDDRYYLKSTLDSWSASFYQEIAKGLVKVDDTDSTQDKLGDKLKEGQGISMYTQSDNGYKTLHISSHIYMATIGGQMKPVYVDSAKGGKVLSVETFNMWWAEAAISDNDWMRIGHATDADSSWVMPFDGVITGATVHCEKNPGVQAKDLRLYINSTETDPQFISVPAGSNATVNDQTKNINFNAGDRIRLRAGSTGGPIGDIVASLQVKWRSA